MTDITYLTEFPDYDADLPDLPNFADDSWHNDACPKLRRYLGMLYDPVIVTVWVDYADPERRESMKARRYTIVLTLTDENIDIAESDDLDQIIDTLRALRWLD